MVKQNQITLRRQYRQETKKSNRVNEGKGLTFENDYVFWLENRLIDVLNKESPDK